MHVSIPVFLTAAAIASSASAFSASANTNVAYYWGQNSAGGSGTQESLAYYCETEDADIMVLAFLNTFYSTGGYPTLAFGGTACSTGTYLSGTSLLQCPDIAADIATCQSLGKKVLLSLGGASGSYGFTSDSEAEEFATELWNLFGGGSSSIGRPFEDAIIDGFDLDIEGGSTTGYAAFADKMREYYDSDTSKAYYLSAAPQCPYPDAYVGTALSSSVFDFIFVQFYNNYCGMNVWEADAANANFNYDTWDTFVKSSPNPDAKLFLGVPGSSSAAGSGYTSASTVGQAANYLQETYDTFGGIMVWDASQAWANTDDGETFAAAIKAALLSDSAATSGSVSTAVAATTSAVTSTSPAVTTTSSAVAHSSSEDTITTTSLTQTETSTSILNTFYTTSIKPDVSTSAAAIETSGSESTVSKDVTVPTVLAVSSVFTSSSSAETAASSSVGTTMSESSSAVETSPALKTTSSAGESPSSVAEYSSSVVESSSSLSDSSSSVAANISPVAQTSLAAAAQATSSAESTTSSSSFSSSSSSSGEAVVVVTATAPAQTTTNTPETTVDAGSSPTPTITLSTSVTGVPTSTSEPEIFTSWGADGPVVVVYHTVWVTTTAAGPTEVVTQYQTNEHYAYATQVIDVRRRKRRNRLSGPAQTSFAIKN